MPQFSYKAKAGPGQLKNGVIEAENQLVVIKKLRRDGLFPISIKEVNVSSPKKGLRRTNSRDISSFTRQLANLIHSGFILSSALSTLSQQNQNQALNKLISSLVEAIQKGATFSDALKAYPRLFSSFYINMVKIGETSGKIDEALERLASFKEREDELLSQIKSSLVYPSFLLVLGIITVFILVTFFFPRLAAMFSSLNQTLPLPTQIIISTSKFMSVFWWLFILVAVLVAFFVTSFYSKEKNRLIVDTAMLRVPFVKDVIQKVEIARFSYALSVLLASGVSMLEALVVGSLSVDNRLFREKILSFQEGIRKGGSLSKCLRSERLFPSLLVNMVAVGEESGELAVMLSRISATFEGEVSRIVKTVVSLVEPVLILMIGGVVVLMVFGMLLPVFQMDFLAR